MIGEYPFGKLDYYPHMKPEDVKLWEKFISAFPDMWETCDYDVLVGDGVVAGDVEKDQYARSFQMLTQKKIDVVVYKGNEIGIIEIKPRAGSTALGQVVGYLELWLKKHPEVSPTNVFMGIVTDEPQSDYATIYANQGIRLFIVGF